MALSAHSPLHQDLIGAPDAAASGDGATFNRLSYGDLGDALRKGLADFRAMPSHLVFIAAIYPIGMLVLAQLSYSFNILPMIFPFIAGFAILGPFVGLGLYEISRRRELRLDATWDHALKAWSGPGMGAIIAVGILLFAIFAAWMWAASSLYGHIMGPRDFQTVGAFFSTVLTTGQGWTLILVGHAVGFCFAAVAFMVSAVSFPLLLDRNAGAGAAVSASVRTVWRNPLVMGAWAAIIAGSLMLSSLLFFAGLAVALPVLAHASWHLYRRAITWA